MKNIYFPIAKKCWCCMKTFRNESITSICNSCGSETITCEEITITKITFKD